LPGAFVVRQPRPAMTPVYACCHLT
jgi:hypothetical protein